MIVTRCHAKLHAQLLVAYRHRCLPSERSGLVKNTHIVATLNDNLAKSLKKFSALRKAS